MGTDIFNVLDLWGDGHNNWAGLSFGVMWNPFLIHLGFFLFDLINSGIKGKAFGAKEICGRIGGVCVQLPFVLPMKNLYHTLVLAWLDFGSSDLDEKDGEKIEQIQHEAGIAGMYESFTEAGPQAVIQLVVIVCTGRITYTQGISIASSLLSLSWASARAFFILRERDYSDPDPEVKTVLMRIFPNKFVIVLNSAILWTLAGALLGKYIFVGISACFVTILSALCILERWVCCSAGGEKIERKKIDNVLGLPLHQLKVDQSSQEDLQGCETSGSEMCEQTDPEKGNSRSVEQTENPEDFKVISSLTSVWLPCVVGRTKNMFLTSALVGLASKFLLLTVAILLNYFNIIETNGFLLECHDLKTAEAKVNSSKTLEICSFDDASRFCIESGGHARLFQKVRICSSPQFENDLRIGVLLVVLITTFASALAIYNLHKISDYHELWKRTRSFCCQTTEPVIHRSMVFDLANNDARSDELANVLAVDFSSAEPPTKKQIQAVNGTRRGKTPLSHAVENGAWKCVRILSTAGAKGAQRIVCELAKDDKNLEMLQDVLGIDHLSQQPPTVAQIEAASRMGGEWGKNTPLEHAILRGARNCAILLCHAGARDADNLVFAFAQDDKDFEKLAELLGVDPLSEEPPTEAQTKAANREWLGETLLQHAAKAGASRCAKIICKAGAKEANTYLIFKLAGDDANSEKLAEMLGVDPSSDHQPFTEKQIEAASKRWQGQSPLEHAIKSGARSCEKILRQAGAEENLYDSDDSY